MMIYLRKHYSYDFGYNTTNIMNLKFQVLLTNQENGIKKFFNGYTFKVSKE